MKLSILFLFVAVSAIVLCAADSDSDSNSDESRAPWHPDSIDDSGLKEHNRNHGRDPSGRPRPPPPRPPTNAVHLKVLAKILKTLQSIDRRLAGALEKPPRPSPPPSEAPTEADNTSTVVPENSTVEDSASS